jgi:hypothetical protein
MLNLPNWLIVYGTNRNAGKTTLITKIIREFGKSVPITAIKISPHFHPVDDEAQIVIKTDDYIIVRETRANTGKDSSRMLESGAEEVFYIQVWDNNLEKVLSEITGLVRPGSMVTCESGWARNLIIPGVFLILNRKGNTDIKSSAAALKPLASRWIEFDGEYFDFNPEDLVIENGKWKLV